ncbi:MAG: LysR family transcriptional regulator [Thermoanaerobaculia bacterium]
MSELRPRWRLVDGDTVALGPGKADLLEAIAGEGSLAGAARRLGMSYMRAWTLLGTMNRAFGRPLVELERGGSRHGAALLTPLGREILDLYRDLERESLAATAKLRRRLAARLSRSPAARRRR